MNPNQQYNRSIEGAKSLIDEERGIIEKQYASHTIKV